MKKPLYICLYYRFVYIQCNRTFDAMNSVLHVFRPRVNPEVMFEESDNVFKVIWSTSTEQK